MSNPTGNEDPKTVAVVGDVIADVFGLPREDVTATTLREDIPEWDSLGHLNLMLALEDAFNVSFTVDEMPDLVSVPAIVAKVLEKCR